MRKAGEDMGDMRRVTVTYLNHSGFLLEWERCYWLFDYYRGEIPRLDPGKRLFVFCSHSHSDHFNPQIFGLADEYPGTVYLFSNQLRREYRKQSRRAGKLPEVAFLYSGTDTEVPDGFGAVIRVHTLHSTDCGCAFYLEYQGKTVYHAGDLHWWLWSGEAEAFNRKMTADYKKEMEYLADRRIDLAFTPLDPRQEADYACGMNYFLANAQVKHVFPMHFWNDFSVIDRYLEENRVPQGTEFYRITGDGQRWELAV